MEKRDVILVVDDDEDFVLLLEWAFEKVGIDCRLLHLGDGREALRYFKAEGRYQDRDRFPLPALLLLDIHLPMVNGFEVLDWLHQHECRSFPIVMLSSSHPEFLSLDRQNLEVAELREKPFSMADTLQFVANLRDHWLAGAHSPGH